MWIFGLVPLGGCEGRQAPTAYAPRLEIGEPSRVIGTEDGAGLVFGSINDVIMRPDGSLLVVDAISAQIWHLRENGELIGTFGGRGDGPGEFATPTEIAPLGEEEYLVLDTDRFELTVVHIEGSEQSYVGTIRMPFQALHLCGSGEAVVVNPYDSGHALVRIDREGSELTSYLPLAELGGSGPTAEARAYVSTRMGIGIPLCRGSGEVDYVPEWGAVVRGFRADGNPDWVHELKAHLTLAWDLGTSGRPEVSLPEEGWVHRATSAHALGPDLIMIQLQQYGEGHAGRVDDPAEVRLVRPSDGAEARIEQPLPTLAVSAGEASWWFSNLPYPRLIQMSLEVVQE